MSANGGSVPYRSDRSIASCRWVDHRSVIPIPLSSANTRREVGSAAALRPSGVWSPAATPTRATGSSLSTCERSEPASLHPKGHKNQNASHIKIAATDITTTLRRLRCIPTRSISITDPLPSHPIMAPPDTRASPMPLHDASKPKRATCQPRWPPCVHSMHDSDWKRRSIAVSSQSQGLWAWLAMASCGCAPERSMFSYIGGTP